MTQPTPDLCPYLGLASDRTVTRTQPDAAHRCSAQTPSAAPDAEHQAAFCLSASHPSCPFYVPPATRNPQPAIRNPQDAIRAWLRFLPWLALALLVIAVAVVYGRDLLLPPAGPPPILNTSTPDARSASILTPDPRLLTPDSRPLTPAPRPARSLATNTPEPGGQAVSLAPKAGDAGWWSSGEARGNRLGDSYLYAGYFDGQAFISAVRLDVSRVPRGAPIRAAMLRLTGLREDRLNRGAGGQWNVHLLAADALKEFARADFQALLNAPAGVSLLPTIFAADLNTNQENTWTFDPAARAWLQAQIAGGATTIIARIVGPTGGESTLFAWDSGAGPATTGAGPVLNLSLGPAPATPPALPSQQVIVATLTPTPANILTVAADRLTATAIVRTIGTVTPLPYRLVTPTPLPANLATAQALGLTAGRAPIVIYTATPANAATATANAAWATAVAVTTGTFTPVPTNAVTPVMVAPTPQPENVATAAAQLLAATAQAEQVGTATPLPFGALIATVTPRPPVLVNTPTPANFATAAAYAAYATAVAVTTGTFTPIPPNALIATPPASATPVPLLLEITPGPTPTPTPTRPAQMPAVLIGQILFRSDRDGQPRLYALDAATGRILRVTQEWPAALAQARDARNPAGNLVALVQEDNRRLPQVQIYDAQFKSMRQLTTVSGWSYDPAWSPRGDRIAFVSNEVGNDEIYIINNDGSDQRRLTANTWEWDKHPSWSPDGSQIVFWSNRETGRRQLWIMDADGKNQRPLMPSVYNDWDPVWVK
jgi:hypothetical protein